jgi:Ca2+-binding RTX toxin-like protein
MASINGTSKFDKLFGLDEASDIRGLGGNDEIRGGAANDIIRGDGSVPMWQALLAGDVEMGYSGGVSSGTGFVLTSMGKLTDGGDSFAVLRIRNTTDADQKVVLAPANGKGETVTVVVPAKTDWFTTTSAITTYKLTVDGKNAGVKAANPAAFAWTTPVSVGPDGDDTIHAGGGDDIIYGNGGDDRLFGESGNDVIEGGKGSDYIDGGAGSGDTADYVGSSKGVQVNLATGKGSGGDAEGDKLTGIEFLRGSMHDDELTGNAGVNRLTGRRGEDILNGGGGNDTLNGGSGADKLIGGAGVDTADYGWSGKGVTVNLEKGIGLGGDAQGDTLQGIENISGSAFADMLTGDAGRNRLNGMAGNDTLRGGAGDDVLVGGAGADTLDGGNGARDVADYTDSAQGVTVDLALGQGWNGDAQGDRLSRIEYVYGSTKDDDIRGDNGVNRLVGNAGNDTIDGRGGIDYILGGAGNDTMTGGTGADVFVLENGHGDDVITDFEAGAGRTDRIWLQGNHGIADMAELMGALTDTAGGALLTTDQGTILFQGLSVADFHTDDFIIG